MTDGVATARLSTAYRQAKVLHSAVELGVFDLLAKGPAGEPQLREELGLHPRLARAFLDALVALGLLVVADGGTATRWGPTSSWSRVARCTSAG